MNENTILKFFSEFSTTKFFKNDKFIAISEVNNL